MRQAWISSSIFGVSRAIQAFGLERYKQNSIKAAKGLQHVLDGIFKPAAQEGTAPGLPLINREKLKETAKKAKDFAKSSSRGPFVTAWTYFIIAASDILLSGFCLLRFLHFNFWNLNSGSLNRLAYLLSTFLSNTVFLLAQNFTT